MRAVSPTAKAISILLAVAPALRMAWIVFTVGENNLSNDYVSRVPLVGALLERTCGFGDFVRHAWIGGSHSTLAVIPIYWLNARFFDWSVWFELGLGLALTAAALGLVAAALPAFERWRLLPVLSLLLFSTSRITVFTFGEPALQYGLSQVGVALGAFALGRWPARPSRLVGALVLGAILASWSWGGGIGIWPVILAALVLHGERRPAAWAIVACGAAAGLFQYVWFLPKDLPMTASSHVPWTTRVAIFLDVLGRPFVDGIARPAPRVESQIAGAAGLIALGWMLVVLRTCLRRQAVALFLVAWAFLVGAQIAFVRSAVAPWYASPSAFFWLGVLLLFSASPAHLRTGGILLVALLALRVQLTWEDKSFYLPSRAPASAACLREWRTAPPECHDRVFQWGPGVRPDELAFLGEMLERKHLSVFGPRRTYLLQGDAILGRVRFEPKDTSCFLSADGRTPGDSNDFRRLDLVLAPGGAVTWRVDLPRDSARATFETRVRGGPPARAVTVSASAEGTESGRLTIAGGGWSSLDLARFAGKTVTLRVESEAARVVLESPRVLLKLRS